MHRGAKDNKGGQPTRKAVADCLFTCPVAECGESFSSQSALQRHRQRAGHTERQLKRKVNAPDGIKEQTVMDMFAKKRCRYVEAAKNDKDVSNEKDGGSESEEEARNVSEDDQVESSSEEEEEEECSAKKCKVSRGKHAAKKKLIWICCDDCDSWYHTLCVGLGHLKQKEIRQLKYTCSCSTSK